MIVMPALAAAGVDVNQLTLSRSTMMDARNESRELMAANVREISNQWSQWSHISAVYCCPTKMERRAIVWQFWCLVWVYRSY